ncbi:MAG: hypothetical protein AAB436_03790 [Patescibacteria group bacterium]
MKAKKTGRFAAKNTAHKRSKAQKKAIKSFLRKKRSLHVRLTLHPASVMVQLCVGVLLIASTIAAFGDSYTVTGKVAAPALTDPAEIVTPLDGSHLSAQALTVTGSCPDNSYVKLYQNSVYVGVGWCNSNEFQISTLLSAGSNLLTVQDYNITDDAGPVSSGGITVYYDPPTGGGTSGGGQSGGNSGTSGTSNASAATSSVVAAVDLQVMQVDHNVPYNPAEEELTTQRPTFSGIAPPYSDITVTVRSNPVMCRTKANAVGFWQCVLPSIIPVGKHSVEVTAVTPDGKTLKAQKFYIRSISQIPSANQAGSAQGGQFTISTNYQYSTHLVGQQLSINLAIAGGVSPYAITIDWGDGTVETILRASTSNSDITHTYKWINAANGSYTIKIQGTDSTGAISATQLIAVLRNPAYHNAVSSVAHSSGTLGLMSVVHSWLWLLWPGYAVVILMLVSFWLGERQEMILYLRAKQARRTPVKRRKRHA